MEVTDSLGNKTYSYQLLLKNSPPKTFYNLNIDHNKNVRVLEYEVEENHFEAFVNSNFNLKHFVGRISFYKGNRFINALRNQEKNALEPCESVYISEDSGNGSGSGYADYGEEELPIGSGDDGGNTQGDYSGGDHGGGEVGGGGANSGCTWEVITETVTSQGTGWDDEVDILEISCPPEIKTSTDCIETSGAYGINVYEYSLYRLEYEYSFNTEQLEWLKNEQNKEDQEFIEFLMKLFNYGISNEFSEQAESFSLAVVDAKMAGGEVDFEDKIILDSSFKNHSRLKCVYDKFKTGTNTIAGYLKNFLPDNAVGHLNFSADSNFASSFPNQTTAGAATFPPVNGANGSNVPGFNINIVFNTDVTLTSSAQNFPTIILAQELIHEMVHAEMYRKLLECAQLPHVNYNNYTGEQWENFIYSLRDNYEGIHDYFMRYKFYKENGQLIPIEGPTEEQHQQMASHYRNMMIAALKDFDNNQHSPEFYNAIAWMGLKGTVAWDDPSVNQSQINSIITNAITNETHNCTN